MNMMEYEKEEEVKERHPYIKAACGIIAGTVAIASIVMASVWVFNGSQQSSKGTAMLDSRYYPQAGWVSELNESEDIVTVTWFNGNQFQFCGVEDWDKGDICAMIMDTNGTLNNMRDDSIVAVRYCGDQHIDLSQVTDCKKTTDGIQFFMNDGTGYYWQN